MLSLLCRGNAFAGGSCTAQNDDGLRWIVKQGPLISGRALSALSCAQILLVITEKQIFFRYRCNKIEDFKLVNVSVGGAST